MTSTNTSNIDWDTFVDQFKNRLTGAGVTNPSVLIDELRVFEDMLQPVRDAQNMLPWCNMNLTMAGERVLFILLKRISERLVELDGYTGDLPARNPYAIVNILLEMIPPRSHFKFKV